MPIVPSTLRAGTRDLPDVPPFVQSLIGAFLAPILAWLSDQVYRRVLTHCASHPLLRLAPLYDFAPVVAACQAYYHAPGTKGATPTIPSSSWCVPSSCVPGPTPAPMASWSGCSPPT